MPPVGAAIAASATAISGAFAAAGAATSAAIGFGTAAAWSAAFVQIAAGVSLSALSAAMAPRPGKPRAGGVRIEPGSGETQARALPLGRVFTAGDLVFHGAYSDGVAVKSRAYVQVFALSDWPGVALRRVWVNGEWAALGAQVDPLLGRPVAGYSVKGAPKLWVKFYDGTQTAPDPGLIANFGAEGTPLRWTAPMVGRGIAYAIVTAFYRAEVHSQRPEVGFELDGVPVYDPRRDSTAGGTGTQRLADRSTWRTSENPVVLAYNVLLGFRDPITGEHAWGGQDISQRDLQPSGWFAAMNECDRVVSGRPQFRAGIEVRLDAEPASVLEELMAACNGEIAEVAGQWSVRVGAPAPVLSITDDDIVVTDPDVFAPFPGLDEAWNAVAVAWSDPGVGWRPKDAPLRIDAAALASDGGRRNVAQLTLPIVFDGVQAQLIGQQALAIARRFRRHNLNLPPEARVLGPLDAIAWTSARNGYIAKIFDIVLVEDQPNGLAALALRERDPSDYDWSDGDILPDDPGISIKPPRPLLPVDFAVFPTVVVDASGAGRRPAIRLEWSRVDGVTAIAYRIRLAADKTHVPVQGEARNPDPDATVVGLKIGGRPILLDGRPAVYSVITEVGVGSAIIGAGAVLPLTAYEVQPWYVPDGLGQDAPWLPVTTPDARLGEADLSDPLNDRILDAETKANQAAEDAVAALAKANEVDALVDGLTVETLDRLEAVVDALAGLSSGDIAELLAIVGATVRPGWTDDPTFRMWSGTPALPDHWTAVATTGQIALGTGRNGACLEVTTASGALDVNLRAASNAANQMGGADPAQEWVAVTLQLEYVSGSLAGARCAPLWLVDAVWTRGDAFGATAAQGDVLAQWGFTETTGRIQSRTVLWRRPAAATAVALDLILRRAAVTGALSARVHRCDVRAAEAAEVAAVQANGYADAAIASYSATLTGPGGALAALREEVTAEWGAAVAGVTTSVVALTNAQGALAGRTDRLEAVAGRSALVRNGSFADRIRPAGEAPDWWPVWPTAGIEIVARGGVAPRAIAPAAFMARFTGAVERTAFAATAIPVSEGDILSYRLRAALEAAGAASVVLGVAWTLAGGAAVSDPRTHNLTSTAWSTLSGADFVAPAGAVSAAIWLRRNAGATANTLVTGVEVTQAERTARALIETAQATAASATSSVATITATVSAEFGDWSSFVSQSASAVATAEGAAGALVFRTIGGKIGLYGWADTTGAGAVVLLDAQNVIAPGTLSTGQLVVTDLSYNMVPDNQLQTPAAWVEPVGEDRFVVRPISTLAALGSVGEIEFTGGSGTLPAEISSAAFAVTEGDRLTFAGQCGRISTSGTYGVQFVARFGAADGTLISAPIWAGGEYSDGTLRDFGAAVTVPAGARTCVYRLRVYGGTARLRFGGVSCIRQTAASTLIRPDGIFTDELIANELSVRTAYIGTLQLSDGAVGRGLDAANASQFDISVADGWVNACSLVLPANLVPGGVSVRALIFGTLRFLASQNSTDVEVGIRCRVGSTTIFEETETFGQSTDKRIISFAPVATVSNGQTVSWQLRRISGGPMRHVATNMSMLTLFRAS
jgi:hypothetical protein